MVQLGAGGSDARYARWGICHTYGQMGLIPKEMDVVKTTTKRREGGAPFPLVHQDSSVFNSQTLGVIR